jgi:hypothetical protein
MSITIAEIVRLPEKDWRWIGERIIASIRHHVQEKRYFKDVPYSDDYKEAKVAGKARSKGVPQSSTSGIPDLTNSGKMMKGLEVRWVGHYGAEIGWIGNDAAKVEWNADMGRAITTKSKPLIPPVDKEFDIDLNAKYAEQVKRTGGSTNINLKL